MKNSFAFTSQKNLRILGIFHLLIYFFLHSVKVASATAPGTKFNIYLSPGGKSLNMYWFTENGEMVSKAQTWPKHFHFRGRRCI